jgi:hypothetical protein
MTRPVKLRLSYRNDAAFLMRLEEAVRKDVRQTKAWKTKVTTRLRELSLLFLAVVEPVDADSSGADEQKGHKPRARKAAPDAAPA